MYQTPAKCVNGHSFTHEFKSPSSDGVPWYWENIDYPCPDCGSETFVKKGFYMVLEFTLFYFGESVNTEGLLEKQEELRLKRLKEHEVTFTQVVDENGIPIGDTTVILPLPPKFQLYNKDHFEQLSKGSALWNSWREENPDIIPDLRGISVQMVNLSGINLSGANLAYSRFDKSMLNGADLRNVNLSNAILMDSDLTDCDFTNSNLQHIKLNNSRLSGSTFTSVDLSYAVLHDVDMSFCDLTTCKLVEVDFTGAKLVGGNLSGLDLSGLRLYNVKLDGVNLERTNLRGANLAVSSFSDTNLKSANLSGCNLMTSTFLNTVVEDTSFSGSFVFGMSAWKLQGTPKDQSDLTITFKSEPSITVDDIHLAQFIYFLINNENVRNAIDTITSKAVLILGRFTDERKMVLDSIRDELKNLNLMPIMFDFEKPLSKDFTGTVRTLANLAKFIIADLTDPRSIGHELASIVPHLTTTPVLPLIGEGQKPYGMFADFKIYPWLLDTVEYTDLKRLLEELPHLIKPANDLANKYRGLS